MIFGDVIKFILFISGTYFWGRLFLKNHWSTWWPPARFAAGIIVGWHLLALFWLVLGHLGFTTQSSWITVLVTAAILPFASSNLKFKLRPTASDTALVVLCAFSVYLLSFLVLPFGRPEPDGLHLSGGHFIDSTWHLSLINQLVESVPPQNPIFAGTLLSNYHYLVDLQVALAHTLTGIPIHSLFFIFVPLVFFSGLSLLVVTLCIHLSEKKLAGALGVLFVLISSNFYYLAPIFFPNATNRPSVAWIDTYSTLAVNYPLTASLSILCILILLTLSSKIPLLKIALLSSTLLLVKSHTALVWLISLGLYAGWIFVAKKETTHILTFVISGAMLTVLTFLIIGKPTQALIFSPLWFIKTMFSSPEHLNHTTWELARQYLVANPGYLGLTKLYLQGIVVFFLINIGPLIIGMASFIRRPLLGLIFIASSVTTLLFVYSNTAIVTIQFFYLAVFTASVGTAVILSRLTKFQSLFIGIFIWLLLLPGVVQTQSQYTSFTSNPTISRSHLDLAIFLSSLPKGTVLLDPEFRNGSWFTAYSGQPAYLGDFQTLPPLGLNFSSRETDSKLYLTCALSLKNSQLKFLVSLEDSCLNANADVRLLYSNSSGSIYEVL